MPSLFKKRLVSQNRRLYRRARSFCLIKYSFLNDPAHKQTLVNPKNISAGGLAFISKTDLTTGAMLDMEMYLPPLKGFFTLIGTIVKTSKIKDTNQYLIRINFKAIDAEDRKRINAYIEEMARHPLMNRYLDKKSQNFKRWSIY